MEKTVNQQNELNALKEVVPEAKKAKFRPPEQIFKIDIKNPQYEVKVSFFCSYTLII